MPARTYSRFIEPAEAQWERRRVFAPGLSGAAEAPGTVPARNVSSETGPLYGMTEPAPGSLT